MIIVLQHKLTDPNAGLTSHLHSRVHSVDSVWMYDVDWLIVRVRETHPGASVADHRGADVLNAAMGMDE